MDEDRAVERMRAADPAAGATPDADRLVELTVQRRGDELAERRARRGPRWAAVAAVTTAALAVGGGAGYGLGRSAEEPVPSADTASTVGTARGDGMQEELAMSAPMSADRMMLPGFGGERTVFTAQGLSQDAGTAAAWAFDGPSVFGEEAVLRAAEVFGVEGEARLEGGWTVGSADGSGPTLSIGPDAAVSVFYNDPALYELGADVTPMPLPEPDSGVDDGGGQDSSTSGAVEEYSPSEEPEVAPDEPIEVEPALPGVIEPAPGADPAQEPAVAPGGETPDGPAGLLYETLAALGLDPEAAEYSTQQHWAGEQATTVYAHQVVGGTRTGYSWHADVVDGEVLGFSGPLAPLVELGEYDVVSPVEAVERLGDPRFGGSMVWTDEVHIMPALPEPSGRSWDDPPAEPPASGSSIPWPVTDVTIVSAEPALTEHSTADGASLLVPAYELSDAEGRTWSVLAVADHELAF